MTGLGLTMVAATALGADCELAAAVEQAEQAFAELSEDTVLRVTAAMTSVECTTMRLPATLVARIHRLDAVRALADRDPPRGVASLAATHGADPHLTWPEMVGPGHPLRVWHDLGAHQASTATVRLPAPFRGELRVDGTSDLRAPVDRPYVVQWVDGESVRFTRRVPAGSAPPPYRRRWSPWGARLGVAGLSLLALSVPAHAWARYGVRSGMRGDALVTTNHVLFLGGVGLTAMGGSLLVGHRVRGVD